MTYIQSTTNRTQARGWRHAGLIGHRALLTLCSLLLVAAGSAHSAPTEEQIRQLAPFLQLHPNERYFPMDPMQFIATSRFRHHRAGASDEGYNKVQRKWKSTNSHDSAYYDVPVAFINGYGLNPDGRNRRPRDDRRGSHWNVFLETRSNAVGARNPDSVVPVFYYVREQGDIAQVSYWWFFGYNDSMDPINHQGDWEHVTIRVHMPDGQVEGAWFAAHSDIKYHPRSELNFRDGRLLVYSAKGSHASYPKVGTFKVLRIPVDETRAGGYAWRTWLNVAPLESQPWRDFAGAWGAVGQTSDTTGPLGPWFRRDQESISGGGPGGAPQSTPASPRLR